MPTADEVLHDVRQRLKYLRDVARDTLVAVARAEDQLAALDGTAKEAQPQHERSNGYRERVGVKP